eukprot:CAMPEP_0114663856 /NCGR_PEP_ID=MMETSP0191-20121206/27735_1 /TAXON_ID=126664 /ORGANISM="Sorites sp." /LENGTH=57 /DNA_ID=CAMNT_0001904435 /DNA_START=50 /DNA_END=219 /DNA_ORIENTATION=+
MPTRHVQELRTSEFQQESLLLPLTDLIRTACILPHFSPKKKYGRKFATYSSNSSSGG